MVAHVAMLMQACQAFAAGAPLVVAGDFNFKPGTQPYELVRRGELDPADPQHPPLPAPVTLRGGGGPWRAGCAPMRSAYREASGGREPELTNYAWSAWDKEEPFVGTLDYVFLSPHWRVGGVRALPALAEVRHFPGFPTAAEPSDHVMVAADLSLEP